MPFSATGSFARAVLRHWWGFVVTGGLGALVAFLGTVTETHVPQWLWVTIIAAGLFYASYRAFTDMRTERDEAVAARVRAEAESQRKLNVRSIRDTLGRFLADGEALMERIEESVKTRTRPASRSGLSVAFMDTEYYSDKDWSHEAGEWIAAVEGYLHAELGSGYVERFRSAAGISPVGHTRFNYEQHLDGILTNLSYRLTRIEQFMQELPSA